MKLFIVISFLVLSSQITLCCTCIGEVTLNEEFKRSDAVFTGKVISKKNITITDKLMPDIYIQRAEYKFQVQAVYKGKIKTEVITITTGLGNGDCGFVFNIGDEYIIYSSFENKYFAHGDKVNKFLYTDICRRTRLSYDLEEIKGLKKRCKFLK